MGAPWGDGPQRTSVMHMGKTTHTDKGTITLNVLFPCPFLGSYCYQSKMKRTYHPFSEDRWSEIEDAAMEEANALDMKVCRALGVGESFITEWSQGVWLQGSESADHFFEDDYPNFKKYAVEAATELGQIQQIYISSIQNGVLIAKLRNQYGQNSRRKLVMVKLKE